LIVLLLHREVEALHTEDLNEISRPSIRFSTQP
jgi:hypothetical protein